MPDETLDQQVSPTGIVSDAGNSGQQEDWKKRYDGLVRKVEQQVGQIRDLTGQLETKTSEFEQLRSQLTVKDAEKLAAVGERDKQIQSAVQAKTAAEGELNELRALKLKVDVINELKRPDLLKIANKIPAMTDPEALKSVLADFAEFADGAAMERERQLKAGMTSTASGTQKVQDLPNSDEAWNKHIENLPLGPDREKAYEQYWDWNSKKFSA